jgi:hypothetical protein
LNGVFSYAADEETLSWRKPEEPSMIDNLRQHTRPLAGLAALTILTACSSDVTGGNRHNVQLSFTTNASVASAANRVAADLVAGPNDELVLQKVQLVFSKIELDKSGNAQCVSEADDENDDHGDDSMNAECEEVELDPLLVNVPVDDALHPVITLPLPAGTFAEMEARLSPANTRFTAFNTANPDLVGKSVRVEGTFNGTSFVFTTPVRARLEMDFDPPLVVDETTTNTTVAIAATTTASTIKPASGVAGTSSACYPSHPPTRNLN